MDKLGKLKKIIAKTVFITNAEEQIGTYDDPDRWIFDFRKILMNGESSELIAELFYEKFKDQYPFQLGALEIAGVPLVVSIMRKFYEKGHTDINAFFIRKSRKKSGLFRMVEGEIKADVEIVLVDDLMNSGNSFWRQIEVLEQLGHKVGTVWSILRFRDESYYTRFYNRFIKVQSLFTLDDFSDLQDGKIKNIVESEPKPVSMPFSPGWRFASPNPSLMWVVPKSQPAIDDTRLYFGSDNETFWALNQEDGSVAWSFSVGKHAMKKSIFSSPVLYEDLVIFGSYDGNLYALDKSTGKKKWVCFDADWIGSSPAVSKELRLVFVGMEFGVIGKRGGIAAVNVGDGRVVWSDYSHPSLTHASPTYLEKHKQVAVGSNDGVLRLYDARTGERLWSFTTFGGATYDPIRDGGFGQGEIKEGVAHDPKRDYLIFGSTDGFLYILERSTGHLVHHYKCGFAVWATPYIYKDKVYFTSLDKKIRCLNLDSFKLIFEKELDGTRIFSSPVVIEDKLYVGTNAARLHELDPENGEKRGYFQAVERITNTVVYNPVTEMYFLPTYANEIIALKRNDGGSTS